MKLSVLPVSLLAILSASATADTVAIVNAKIVPVTKSVIPSGTILIRDDKIVALAAKLTIPKRARIVDAKGLTAYPGLVAGWSQLGLREIGSVDMSNDLTENNAYSAQLDVRDAFNTSSAFLPIARANGVTTIVSGPSGPGFSGQAAIFNLSGRTVAQMLLKPYIGMGFQLHGMNPTQKSRTNKEVAEEAMQYTRNYIELKKADPKTRRDLFLEALIPIVNKKRPLLVFADSESQIREALEFADKQKVRIIIVGGAESHKVAKELKERTIPVIFSGILNIPSSDEQYDARFRVPGTLHKAGVKVCIVAGEAHYIGIMAGMAAAYGLPKTEALKSVTLYPAQALGVDQEVGSLEPGKKANIVLCDGDILEYRTRIKTVFINGRETDLKDKHRLQYERYRPNGASVRR